MSQEAEKKKPFFQREPFNVETTAGAHFEMQRNVTASPQSPRLEAFPREHEPCN